MNATSRRGTAVPRLLAVALPLLLAGCVSAFSGQDGMRVLVKSDAIYVVIPGPVAARTMCVAAGLRTPGLDGRSLASTGELTLSDAGVAASAGCQGQVRSVIVCANGDARCLSHEERHAREGAFHQ
jgi:hypothetical protein